MSTRWSATAACLALMIAQASARSLDDDYLGPSEVLVIVFFAIAYLTIVILSYTYGISGLVVAASYPNANCCCWRSTARDCCRIDIRNSNIIFFVLDTILFIVSIIDLRRSPYAYNIIVTLLVAGCWVVTCLAVHYLNRAYAKFGAPATSQAGMAYTVPTAQVAPPQPMQDHTVPTGPMPPPQPAPIGAKEPHMVVSMPPAHLPPQPPTAAPPQPPTATASPVL